ncbi:hypothetical protein [uncultured Fibrobacter sp.]|uniref:hypothetical protein n=1 Tax=uncultured Fibrobacter sp. TaxID=261512 RepID=UPI002804B2AC|nr:hypothetical protein [uncultured Fibrobacter sp.]
MNLDALGIDSTIEPLARLSNDNFRIGHNNCPCKITLDKYTIGPVVKNRYVPSRFDHIIRDNCPIPLKVIPHMECNTAIRRRIPFRISLKNEGSGQAMAR